MNDFDKKLDFDSNTFENMKHDMNFVLQRLLGNMIEKQSNEGSMTIKIDVTMVKEFIPNYDPNIRGRAGGYYRRHPGRCRHRRLRLRRSGGVDMGLMKPRVSSYVDRGNELIAKGKTKQAMNLVSHGLQYYSERVIDSISPYAKNDAGLIVLVLRHLADEVEKNNPGAKELAAGMEKCVGKPSLQEIERIKKPNRK